MHVIDPSSDGILILSLGGRAPVMALGVDVKGAGSSIRSSPIQELTLSSGDWGRQCKGSGFGVL